MSSRKLLHTFLLLTLPQKLTYVSVLMSIIIAASSLTATTPYLIDFTRAATAAAEMFKLIDRESLIDPLDQSGESPGAVTGDIDFENVTFCYPMRPNTTVLDNYSLKFPAGKTTALVGASGSGKSTIVGLLERWYNPASGSIKLDGKSIQTLNLKWLRQQVRLVQQEPVLFSGSVYDNIVNGLAGTSWEHEPQEAKLARVQEAAKIAFAHDFITDLPNGYDTVIGERGGLLSGGQKQRVAIARSIISQPRILLLDEATSALDPHAEQIVQQALDNVSQGRTTITIAHKLATVRNADNIVVMQQGCIIEQGTYDSLLDMDGAFSRLVKAQDLAAADDSSDTSTETDNTDEQGGITVQLSKTLTRRSSTTHIETDRGVEKYNYDNWKHLGFLSTVWRLVLSAPELRWYYVALISACFAAGMLPPRPTRLDFLNRTYVDLWYVAAAYPGQSILMSRFIEVFQYTGSEMQKRGNFFASMFLVLAIGACVVYFVMGWCSNTIATVRPLEEVSRYMLTAERQLI